MTSGTDPGAMSGQERMAEVSMLLSLAMMRLWLKRRGGACQAASRERALSAETAGIPLAPPQNDGSV